MDDIMPIANDTAFNDSPHMLIVQTHIHEYITNKVYLERSGVKLVVGHINGKSP